MLQSAIDTAKRGFGRTALVSGEAGIGKTSLVTMLVSAQRDVRVLWGGCEALYSPRRLGPRSTTAANPSGLAPRELQVLGLLSKGLTSAEIARRLARSEKTVDHHVAAVLRKLEVRSRGEATVVAIRLGLQG